MHIYFFKKKKYIHMKLNTILLSSLGFFIIIILNSNSSGPASAGNGDRTGAPGSNGTCANCHSGGSFGTTFTAVVKNSQNATVTSYLPDSTYNIEFTVGNTSGSPKYGMQATVLNGSNNTAGTLSNPSSNAKISTANNRSILEHSARSTSGTFTVEWKAPAAGTGSVSIYGTGMAVNGAGTIGDSPQGLNTVVLTEGTLSSVNSIKKAVIQYTVFPNPTSDYINIRHNAQSGEAILQVHNFVGQLVKEKQVNLVDNEQLSVDVQDIPTGVYTFSIQKDGAVYSKVIQKQ